MQNYAKLLSSLFGEWYTIVIQHLGQSQGILEQCGEKIPDFPAQQRTQEFLK